MRSAEGTSKRRVRLTLGQAFVLPLVGLAVALGALLYLLLRGWQGSITVGARELRREKSASIASQVEEDLQRGQKVLEDLERQVRHGAVRVHDPLSLEASLFSAVLNNPALAEAALTHATKLGDDEHLRIRVAPEDRWQLSVARAPGDDRGEGERILSRHTRREGRRFVSEARDRPPGGGLLDGRFVRVEEVKVPDPTEHATFTTPASTRSYGDAVWTDLHHSELDAALPEQRRRVVASVMKAIEDRQGRFVGVLRVSRLTAGIDDLVRRAREENPDHQVFICDEVGRLITRGVAADLLREEPDTSLRVPLDGLPPEILHALRHPALHEVRRGNLETAGEFVLAGRRYLVNFRGLGQTQDWRVGIVVAEDSYLRDLIAARNRLVPASLVVLALVLVAGGLTVRAVRGGLGQIVGATGRMRNFDFAPSEISSPFRDVQAVTESLELAKTALRAMGKYVPVDLVRHLYQTGREPVLGGEMLEVSLMFTDIRDFTALSERLSPNDLARSLGRYLEVMTAAIHETQGIIDKYVGDAVMAVWNASRACPDHPRRACEAALRCVQATEALFASPAWDGRPPLVTRFGLHRDVVMVGHFGAPDRMSFTALGDGVNLASRLEGLNKQYGTTILVSEAVESAARGEFEFRLVDVVAVKGRTKGVRVYELLGPSGEAGPRVEAARAYERAFDAYRARRFGEALALLETAVDDGPSRVLAERCRSMLEEPPPPDWDGVYVSRAK